MPCPLLLLLVGLVLGAVVAVLVLAARQPTHLAIVRKATFAAPPEAVYAEVASPRRWHAWSPWAEMDPSAQTTYSGPEEGLDAAMAWEGKKSGVGKMTVVEAIPASRLRFRLDFEKPFKATHYAEFTFRPEGGTTHVTWSMESGSACPLIGKVVGLLLNCPSMCAAQFDRGFVRLRDVVEKA
ncbi:MAG TPA: SRPBCC family protein [Candidatus Methylacidiphilales bacterium]